jgi:hypothetical protein
MNFALSDVGKIRKEFVFLGKGMVRPGGCELPTFWFVANGVKILNALFGVAYGLETPFFPQLAAPNPAPKTNSYRTRTVYFIGSIRKADDHDKDPIETYTNSALRQVIHFAGVRRFGEERDANRAPIDRVSQMRYNVYNAVGTDGRPHRFWTTV